MSLSHEEQRVKDLVNEVASRLDYSGTLGLRNPSKCKDALAWLVIAEWVLSRMDRDPNQLNQVVVFLVWSVGPDDYKIRPFYVSNGPCESVEVVTFMYREEQDQKLLIRLRVEEIKTERIIPPWLIRG